MDNTENNLGAGTLTKIRNGNRPRVLVLASDVLFEHFFPEPVRARLSEVADWVRYGERSDSALLREQIAQSDALMTTWHSPFLNADMLGSSPRVRLIAHCGGEVKSRVAEELFDQIAVTNAAEPMAAAVAEMALTLMLTSVRNVNRYVAEMSAGLSRTNENVSEGETVQGRQVGIVGFGRIGQAFAKVVRPLGVQLLVADPHCSPEVVSAHEARLVELDELVRSCSVVILAAGLTPETRNIFDAERLALLPDGSLLVNVARGGLIEMEALVAELRSHRIRAALDVTDPFEPLPADHELRRLPNVLLTPHIAAGGIEVRRAMGAIAVAEVVRFAKNEAPQNLVTRAMLATMT